jgi:signal transduction histidine kinase
MRSLRTRLLLWFFAAIFVAFGSSALVVGCSRPEAFTTGTEVMARTMSARVEALWDDPRAVDDYIDRIREVTGFDVKLERDLRSLPRNVRRVAQRGGAFAPDGTERILVPITRGGKLVAAVKMDRYGGGLRRRPLWILPVAAASALLLLTLIAFRVANMLARPLEELARASDRLGAGDLAVRAQMSKRAAGEVQKVASAFNQMAERVEATVRGQRELLGAISHELRSPLGRARVALEIERERPGTQLDAIESHLGQVDLILGDLLEVTRAGLADLRKEDVEIVSWLTLSLETEENLVIEAPKEAHAMVDRALLARAVHNIVGNARAHGHPQAEPLRVTVTRDAKELVIAVRDKGPGFPPSFLPRAFEPFVRGDRSRSHSGGSGLGLALVKRIAEAHGGSAFARNVEGGGAEVGVRLPVSKEAR